MQRTPLSTSTVFIRDKEVVEEVRKTIERGVTYIMDNENWGRTEVDTSGNQVKILFEDSKKPSMFHELSIHEEGILYCIEVYSPIQISSHTEGLHFSELKLDITPFENIFNAAENGDPEANEFVAVEIMKLCLAVETLDTWVKSTEVFPDGQEPTYLSRFY